MKKLLIVGILLAVFFIGLKLIPEANTDNHGEHLLEYIRQHQEVIQYEDAFTTVDTAHLLKVHSDMQEVRDFFTEKRSAVLTSFPCTNCHTRPLTQMKRENRQGLKRAHWDIQLVHANGSIMNCTSCHDSNNMDQLSTLTGDLLDMNFSFQLCGQCHSSQLSDWQGGAHGKQLNGWKPPRVVKTCVSCHNPHQPSFPKRFPARYNTNDLEKQ